MLIAPTTSALVLISARHTRESGLNLPVLPRHVCAARARAAHVVRRYREQHAGGSLRLVLKLMPEFAPALIEDSLVGLAFARTFPPGAATELVADLLVFNACKSSIHGADRSSTSQRRDRQKLVRSAAPSIAIL